jgi:hypothetical protein
MPTAPLARSPCPVPFGWFSIGYPEDFAIGQPKAIFYFDRHLVAWRDDTGALTYRTLLPAPRRPPGHGGTVEDCQIVCPSTGGSSMPRA